MFYWYQSFFDDCLPTVAGSDVYCVFANIVYVSRAFYRRRRLIRGLRSIRLVAY